MVLRSVDQFAEVAGQLFRPGSQFGHHGSEQHGGASDCSASSVAPATPEACAGLRAAARPVPRQSRQRRESSEPRISCSRAIQRAQPRFGVAYPGLDPAHLGGNVDQLLVELAAVLTDRGDIGFELLLDSIAFFCWARVASSSCSRCLMASGEAAAVCGAEAATCAVAGNRLIPAKPADNKAIEAERGRTRPAAADGVRVRMNVLRWLHLDRISVFQSFHLRGLGAVIRMTRQNGRGPINLFQKHDANHLMRPGRGAECNAQLCLAP